MNMSETGTDINTSEGQFKLVGFDSPVLHTATGKFDFYNPPFNPVGLYQIMGNKLLEYDGLGLAAPQIGLPYNFFVIRSDPVLGFFNAKIVDTSEEELLMDEACLSYPGLTLKIKRPQVIRVRYQTPDAQFHTQVFQDMTARIIQHELDHVNGIVMSDRASKLQLEFAIKKANKNGQHYKMKDFITGE